MEEEVEISWKQSEQETTKNEFLKFVEQLAKPEEPCSQKRKEMFNWTKKRWN